MKAWKLVIWAAAVLYAAAFADLLRRLGHPSSIAVLGLPLALGYPFFFALVSLTAAMPLVLFALGAALSHREAPTLRSGVVLALWGSSRRS